MFMAGQKRDQRYDDRLPDIGRRLAAVREKVGLNQDAMAKFMGFSRRQWVSWEAGQVSPSVWLLLEMMEKLQIDPAWVIEGPGEVPILRCENGGIERLARLRREIGKMAKELGLGIPEGFERRLAMNVFGQPVNKEREAKREVQEMLRELALGKDN